MGNWEAFANAKRTAVEYLAVFIASAGFVFGVIGCVIAVISMWVAYDANENAKIAIMYINEHNGAHSVEK